MNVVDPLLTKTNALGPLFTKTNALDPLLININVADPLAPGGVESEGSRDNLSPSGQSDSTSYSTSQEQVDQLDGQHNNNRLYVYSFSNTRKYFIRVKSNFKTRPQEVILIIY